MTEITTDFGRLGLSQYVDRFIEHGFDCWESLECVTEEDFEFLSIKLGHRRVLQKEIARRQGYDDRAGQQPQVDGEDSSWFGGRTKRPYRRHPKPDGNAPVRPYSAYAMFANQVRDDVQSQNLSFVRLAKLAGQRWQALAWKEKSLWLRIASDAKNVYDAEMAIYRETEEYHAYSEYLTEFKAKNPRRQTPDRLGRHQNPSNLEGEAGPSSSTSHDQAEPAVDGLQSKRLRDDVGRQESLILKAYDLIAQELEKRSFSSLDHSDVPKRADFDVSTSDSLRHVRVINPFRNNTFPQIQPYLESFLQRLNTVFYVFEPAELTSIFHLVFEASGNLPNQVMSEVCLVLALGVQISDDASEDRMIMWYENGRRYLDDENWQDELWLMRIMVLISAYHAGDRRGTSRHYLDIAIDIGQANGFRQGQSEAKDDAQLKWFQVWQTVDNWLAIPSPSGALEKSHLCSSGQNKERITPAAMNQLSAILRCISDEQKAKPLEGFHEIVVILISWAAALPEELQYSPRRLDSTHSPAESFSQLSEPQRSALLHLQSMLLGTIMLLTLPVLLDVIQGRADASPENKANTEEAAFLCIESASDVTELCSGMFRAGFLPPRAWLPLYFLFSASMVSVIGLLWQRTSEDENDDQLWRSIWCRQRALSAVDAALEIFADCGSYSNTALWYWTVLANLQRRVRDNDLDAALLGSQGFGFFDEFSAGM